MTLKEISLEGDSQSQQLSVEARRVEIDGLSPWSREIRKLDLERHGSDSLWNLPGLKTAEIDALVRGGYHTIHQTLGLSEEDLLTIKDIGPTRARRIEFGLYAWLLAEARKKASKIGGWVDERSKRDWDS